MKKILILLSVIVVCLILSCVPEKKVEYERGNLTELPYEMAHVRRHMFTLIKMGMEHFGHY